MNYEPPTTISRANANAVFALLGIDASKLTSVNVSFYPDHIEVETHRRLVHVTDSQSWFARVDAEPAADAVSAADDSNGADRG